MIIPLDLIDLSKWAGQRFDLVQAGGGNSSYKESTDSMIIKSSGVSLSEAGAKNSFVAINTAQLLKGLIQISKSPDLSKAELEKKGEELLLKSKTTSTDESVRPSIETFLHAFLDTYVLHTHGIVVNAIACRKNWRETFLEVYPDALCVNYKTPGVELALELSREIENYQALHDKKPSIIFLQNHGLIVSAASAQEVKFITEEVTMKLEQLINITNNTYRLTSVVSENVHAVFGGNKIAYLSNDAGLRELILNAKHLFFQPPFFPDTLVYCGSKLVVLNDFNDHETLAKFKELFPEETPRVILCRDLIFFIADSVRKAREIEEVLKFHLSVLVVNITQNIKPEEVQFLAQDELSYLAAWEAEKYRQVI